MGWMGKLKVFRLDVLSAINTRWEAATLTINIWTHSKPPHTEADVAPAASSSEPAPPPRKKQKTPLPPAVDEEDTEESGDVMLFPKAAPVEAGKPSKDADLVRAGVEFEAEARWAERMSEMVECMNKLDRVDWLDSTPDKREYADALDWIFERGLEYCDTFMNGSLQAWSMGGYPRYIRPWFSETERVYKALARRGWIPFWMKHPRDKWIRPDAAESATGFVDPGNLTLDVFVHVFRLWRFIDVIGFDAAIRQPQHPYGHKTNMSSKGPVNLRGNIVEASLKDLQKMGGSRIQHWQQYSAVAYWSHHWWENDPRPSAEDYGSRGSGAAAASSSAR